MSADPMQNVTPHEEPKLSALPAPAVPAESGYAFWTAERACCCPAKPAVVAVLPPAPGRDHETDLLPGTRLPARSGRIAKWPLMPMGPSTLYRTAPGRLR